jgi:GDP-4-dehydro-6-deoxy-D-mannose reductase
MKALITGISGFVGSYLAEYLLNNTDWQVAGTVYGPYGNIKDLCGTLELYPAELSRLDVVSFILEQSRPDYIFHLAAQPLPSVSRRDPWGTLETNIRMQLNILQAVVDLKMDNCRILVVGSSEEYGLVHPEELPMKEDNPFRPLHSYALSKIGQDLLGLQYYLNYKVQAIRVRPFNHIGPRQRTGFVAPDFAQQIAEVEAGLREPVVRVGNLDARRDFTDVRDVVRAYHLAITMGQAGEVYNIGSGQAHSIQELLDILLAMSTAPITVERDSARMRPSDMPLVVADCSKFRAQTGWQPVIPFKDTLRDVLDYWRAQVISK